MKQIVHYFHLIFNFKRIISYRAGKINYFNSGYIHLSIKLYKLTVDVYMDETLNKDIKQYQYYSNNSMGFFLTVVLKIIYYSIRIGEITK